MRDIHQLDGPKLKIPDIETAHLTVCQFYPTATRHGSVGAWHWAVGDAVVAEAWLHRTDWGWWLRVKKNLPSRPGT